MCSILPFFYKLVKINKILEVKLNSILKNRDYRKMIFFVFICLLLHKSIENYNFFFKYVEKLLETLTPFFWGIGFAYILNPLMILIEKKNKKINRVVSLLLVYFIFFGLLTIFSLFVIPVITENLKELYEKSFTFPKILYDYIDTIPNKELLLGTSGIDQIIEENISNITKWLLNFSNITISSIVGTAFIFTSKLLNFVLGLFVSIYFLYEKEKLIAYIKKVIRAFSKRKKADLIIDYFSRVNSYFYNFLVGKLVDSSIIGLLCLLGMSALKIRYALLLSIIVGVLNMIPYFGPFMGAVPAVLITLIYSPIQALWTAIFILILQQFDGWYLGPKILGDSVGATPLFIIFSILVGGSFAGPLGMLLAVPLFKSLFMLWDAFLDARTKKLFDENGL